MIDKYDEIIQEQLKEGIVERVVEEPNERVFYIPHKPVKRKHQQRQNSELYLMRQLSQVMRVLH